MAEEQENKGKVGGPKIGTVDQILEAAPNDLIEETLFIPEWKCAVKVRSFTAAQSARIRQRGLGFKGEETTVSWAEMEMAQFAEGVIEPAFTADQVRTLHKTSGRGFGRVIAWLDEHSNMDKEELRKAREEFQESS